MGPAVETFSYAREVAPIMGAFIFVSLVELPIVHLLLPWPTLRLAALALSVWGLLWMIGLLASMKVFPHLADDEGLRVRYGTSTDIRIPWDAVARVGSRRRSVDAHRHVHVERGDGGTVVSVAVVRQTNVDVALRRPTAVAVRGGTEEIAELRLFTDDARALVARAHERLAASAAEAAPASR
jgi:hypothetical protein